MAALGTAKSITALLGNSGRDPDAQSVLIQRLYGELGRIFTLNEALECLAELDSRQSRIVELHFFGGVSFEEIAELLGIAVRTVKRDWSMARSWLFNQLSARA